MSAGSPGSTARTEGRPFPPVSPEERHAQVSDDEAIPRDKVAAWSDERRRERVLREFRGWLADLERSRICDRSEAVVEIPISPALRRRLALPDGQATNTVDSKYLVVARPSAEEVEEVAGRIAALAAQDEEPSVLAGRLTALAGQFLDYPATHKLVVLSKARASYGLNHITAYNADEFLEYDDGGGLRLSVADVETSYEQWSHPREPLGRYGYLFSIHE